MAGGGGGGVLAEEDGEGEGDRVCTKWERLGWRGGVAAGLLAGRWQRAASGADA
jgi:hypothetical protein